MKNFPLLFFFVFFFAFAVAAQTNQNPACPTLDISGGGMPEPGKPLSFTAHIDTKGKELKLKYNWLISGGEITAGQGTLTITVKSLTSENATATIEVEGFPEGCPNTASETGPICSCIVLSILIGEFSIPASQINKEGLDELVNNLQENPNAQGYVIEYFKRGTPQRVVKQKIQKTTDYLVNKKQLEKDRVTILIDVGNTQNLTKLWIVPPGAAMPEIEAYRP
jgi:hypothetical protein